MYEARRKNNQTWIKDFNSFQENKLVIMFGVNISNVLALTSLTGFAVFSHIK